MVHSLRLAVGRQLRLWPVRALFAVLAVGALMRLVLLAQWRPGFIGYPDSGAYLLDAFQPFIDPLRVTGYGVFIRWLHDLHPTLTLVTVAQHCMGLTVALMLYVTMRQLGVRSRWAAVVPAAVVALGASQIVFEHALLTETLWLWLLTISLLALSVAARPGGRPGMTIGAVVVAGLALGLSVPVRLPGLFLLPVFAIWLGAVAGGSRKRRAAIVALLIVTFAAPVYGYAAWQQNRTGRFGLTRNGILNFYGRVAPWADCTKFTPPAGTQFLCETTPVRQRQGHDFYLFAGGPATQRFGVGSLSGVLSPQGSRQLQDWSRAAVLGQPLTFAYAVLRESRRIIDPAASPGLPGQTIAGFGLPPSAYLAKLSSSDEDGNVLPNIAAHYPGGGGIARGKIGWLRTYDRLARPQPLLVALMLALALMAPFITRGRERRAAWLLTPTALLLLEVPVVTSTYDYRYVFPVFGFLAAAAAIGGWSVVVSTSGWFANRRALPTMPAGAKRVSGSSR